MQGSSPLPEAAHQNSAQTSQEQVLLLIRLSPVTWKLLSGCTALNTLTSGDTARTSAEHSNIRRASKAPGLLPLSYHYFLQNLTRFFRPSMEPPRWLLASETVLYTGYSAWEGSFENSVTRLCVCPKTISKCNDSAIFVCGLDYNMFILLWDIPCLDQIFLCVTLRMN